MITISVIVPVFYGEKYVPDIIHQVEEGRTYLASDDNVEIIFVNDAPDAPLSEKWQSDMVDIKIINSECNNGIHGARVKGLGQCHSDFILFLDQDDRIRPDYFYTQLHCIGEADAVICRAISGGKEVYFGDRIFKNMVSKEFVLKVWDPIVSPGQVLIRRKSMPDFWVQNIMQKNGADDWLLWLCMMADGCRFSLNEDIVFEHVIHDSNTSNNIPNMLQSEQELIRIILKNRIFSDEDFQLLMEGFFLLNQRRTQKLCNEKKKLNVIDRWLKLKEKDKKYTDFLRTQNIQTIAIYGCGVLGEFLYNELKDNVDVSCFIDRNAKEIQKEIPVYMLQNMKCKVDGIVITLIEGTEKVRKEIEDIVQCKVFVLKEWIVDAGRE